MSDYHKYTPGDAYTYCDRTGAKVRMSETVREWTGLRVRKDEFEARHPQDFVRSAKDKQINPYLRSEPPDRFSKGPAQPDDSTLGGFNELPPELR